MTAAAINKMKRSQCGTVNEKFRYHLLSVAVTVVVVLLSAKERHY